MTTKKEKLFTNIVLAVFIAGIICCFTLYPILCDSVSAEELTTNSVLDFNQLFNNTISRDNYNTITITKSNFTYSIKGYFTDYPLNLGFNESSASIKLISGHKYYLDFNLNVLSGSRPDLILFDDSSHYYNIGSDEQIISMTSSPTCSIGLRVNPSVNSSSNPYNFNSTPMLVDLTQCFGSGNEPSTVQEFRSYFVNDTYSYTLSTLVPLDATTSYSQGYTDGIQSFSIVTAADDIYNSSYYAKDSIADILSVNDTAPYFIKLVPSSDTDDHLIFPMISTIPANSNFTISGYISSYIHDYTGTLNIYSFVNNKDYIKLGSINFNNSKMSAFSINFNLPFSVSNIAFDSTQLSLLGDVTVTYKVSNLQKLAQDNYDAGRASRDSDVTIAFENGKRVGMSQANPYTFNALFGAVFDAPIKALTGLLDFDILGVNMKGLYLSLFTLALIIFVVKLCLGKV